MELPYGQPAPGREFTLDVRLDPRGRGISGVQFKLDVPGRLPEVLDITRGSLLGANPLQVNQPASEPGTIVYAVARRGKIQSPAAKGLVATVRLKAADEARPGNSRRIQLEEEVIADQAIQRISKVSVGPALELQLAPAP